MKKFGMLIAAAIIGSTFTLAIVQFFGLNKKVIFTQSDTPIVRTSWGGTSAQPVDFTQAAARTMPSVVHIKSKQTSSRQRVFSSPFGGLFDDDFFFQNPQEQQAREATGSGVIVSEDGYIVTNNHVIEDADDIEISLHDNRTFKAKVIGTDASTDLALLKIEGSKLIPIGIANSDSTRVGEFVLAVGNPFNLTSTVTAGIISAKARSINGLKNGAIEAFIQTDAAVNPGNSGGALVNTNGDLIGINSAIASPTGSYAGYSFAIPSNIVNKVIKDLKKHGVVQRAYLGINMQSLNGEVAKQLNIDLTEGVYVAGVLENSAASTAGIKTGDVVIGMDNANITNASELQEVLGRHSPNDKIKIKVNRSGSVKEFEVTLRNQQGTTEIVKKDDVSVLKVLGVSLEPVSEKDAQKMGIPSGLKVKEITNGKISQQTNMKAGFIVITVNGKTVKTLEDFTKAVDSKKGGVMVEGIYPGYSQIFYYAFGL